MNLKNKYASLDIWTYLQFFSSLQTLKLHTDGKYKVDTTGTTYFSLRIYADHVLSDSSAEQ